MLMRPGRSFAPSLYRSEGQAWPPLRTRDLPAFGYGAIRTSGSGRVWCAAAIDVRFRITEAVPQPLIGAHSARPQAWEMAGPSRSSVGSCRKGASIRSRSHKHSVSTRSGMDKVRSTSIPKYCAGALQPLVAEQQRRPCFSSYCRCEATFIRFSQCPGKPDVW